MPRTRPLPEVDGQICARLIAFRKGHRWTRREVARTIGVNEYTLAAIETGKSPVRFDLAWKLKDAYKMNLIWLATGKGDMTGNIAFSPSRVPHHRMSFSLAWESYVRPAMRDTLQCLRALGEVHAAILPVIGEYGAIAPDKLQAVIEAKKAGLPEHLHPMLEVNAKAHAAQFVKMKAEGRLVKAEVSAEYLPAVDKDNLDTVFEPAIVSGMRSEDVPTWKQLKKSIAQLTTEHGAKSALAAKFGVSRQVLGNWLSSDDQGAPNAELTLRLFKWVLEHRKSR